jgi:hypothetical protein
MPNPGDIAINKKTGASLTWNGQGWIAGKTPPQEASMRARMDIGMAPMVKAQEDMAKSERGGVNPLDRDWGATVMDGINIPIPFTSGANGQSAQWSPLHSLAKRVGGQDYQDYTQASKSFEAQVMPIMSGAAVSPSEAARQIQASLPEMGDSPQTLQTKARTRAMMLNGAAKSRGLPLPYPDVPTWGVNTIKTQGQGDAPAGGQPRVRRYNPQTGRIE